MHSQRIEQKNRRSAQTAAAFLLAALMLSGITACGSTEAGETTLPDGSGQESETAAKENTNPYIEKADYGGASFTILAPVWGLYQNYFFADGQRGEVMNDAIWKRKTETEEYLNISIGYRMERTIDELPAEVKSFIMAGEDPYQMVLTHCITGVGDLVLAGAFLDWNTIPGVDLTRPYWNQYCNKTLSIADKQFYAVSDFMLADPNGILFNRQLITDFSLENPYQLVRDGTWTVDKMTELAVTVTEDINGDGVMDENDRYGVSSCADFKMASFYNAAGIYLVEKDSEGNPALSFWGDRTVELISKLDNLYNQSKGAYHWAGGDEESMQIRMWSGRTLFELQAIGGLKNYRDCEVEFGILPYPKFDEAQETYYSNDWSGLSAIPSTVRDTGMCGKAAEMLAFFSADTTIPAYYDLLLGEKLSRDADSREMLSVIFDNVVYDPGLYYFGWGKISQLYHSIKTEVVLAGKGNLASFYTSRQKAAEQEIENFINDVNQMET